MIVDPKALPIGERISFYPQEEWRVHTEAGRIWTDRLTGFSPSLCFYWFILFLPSRLSTRLSLLYWMQIWKEISSPFSSLSGSSFWRPHMQNWLNICFLGDPSLWKFHMWPLMLIRTETTTLFSPIVTWDKSKFNSSWDKKPQYFPALSFRLLGTSTSNLSKPRLASWTIRGGLMRRRCRQHSCWSCDPQPREWSHLDLTPWLIWIRPDGLPNWPTRLRQRIIVCDRKSLTYNKR